MPSPVSSPGLSASECARHARVLYGSGPFLARKFQHLRPYICPFERCLEFVSHGSRVLDVGCGSGLFLGLLAKTRAISGVGFDVSEPAIQMARAMAARLTLDLRFLRLDVGDPWPVGEFDVVSTIDVAHHVPPRAQRSFLEQAASSVRPGGTLLYKDMCKSPSWRAAANRSHDLLIARQWIHELPMELAEKWIVDLGFDLVCAERINRLWYGHDLLVFRRKV